MRFSLHVSTANAAFWDEGSETFSPEDELGRILAELGGRLASDTRLVPGEPIRLNDFNGNRVGFAVLEKED